jgi:cytoskeletal protein CcmA (bactofilin family)
MSEERASRMASVLGATGIVLGNVEGQGDLEIRGRVQGSVTLAGRVVVADTGEVLGNIEASQATIAGRVRGDLVASEGVSIAASGDVEGNISAPRVAIEAGARVRGSLRTGTPTPDAKVAKRPERELGARAAPPAEATAPVVKLLQEEPPEDELDAPEDDEELSVEPTAAAPSRKRRRRRRGRGERDAQSPGEVGGPSERVAVPERQVSERPSPRAPGGKERKARGAPPALPTFVKGARGQVRS